MRVFVITPRYRAALRFIARRPDCPMKELAHELDCSNEAASSVTQTLKLNGFLQRPSGFTHYALTRAAVEVLAA
jgi:DNA-binding IclR family transcriptional regulator